ncbi:hypothetical protein [Dorea sp.]
MTIVEVIKKTLLPLAAMTFWVWMVKTIMAVSGVTDPFMFLVLAGLPFGIHKMCIILIPKQSFFWEKRIDLESTRFQMIVLAESISL